MESVENENSIKRRLAAIISHYENGNGASFARKTGLNDATLRNYLNGRVPKADLYEKV